MNQLVQILMMACTIAQEAAGEAYEGKLAVGYVIRNRSANAGKSYTDTVLRSMQFSCWNTESPTRMNLDLMPDHLFAECLKASLAASFLLEPDPTNGAVFYLNPTTVIGQQGELPDWWDIDGDPKSEIVIGHHAFRKHR